MISPHELEDNAEVTAEQEIVSHADDVEPPISVQLTQRLQYFDLDERLMMKPTSTLQLRTTEPPSSSSVA